MNGIIQRLGSRAHISGKMLGLLSGVSLLAVSAVPATAEDNALRIISLNTWGASTLIPEAADLLSSGNYDFITIQEYRNSYGVDIQKKMAELGAGDYSLHEKGDTGLAWRDKDIIDYSNTDEPVHVVVGGENGRPQTIIATEHLDYRDDAFLHRNREAHELNDWAAGKASPIIMTGDFNAGDISERGLLEVVQQEFMMKRARETGNADHKAWALQYVARNHAIGSEKYAAAEAYINRETNTAPEGLFTDETYPVAGNTPYTMNLLKKQYQILQNPEDRERFAPHKLADGSTTWPSVEEDDEAFKWPSWGRTQIDHFIASRPYAKWWELTDAEDDRYVGGVLDQDISTTESGKALSDHEPLAHEIRWKGPNVEEIGDDSGKVRLTFDANTRDSAERAGEFRLSRNNHRTDVYLGQLSDEDGRPIYAQAPEVSEDRLGFLLANAVYDRHDPEAFQEELSLYVPAEQQAVYKAYLDKLTDTSNPEFFRNVLDDYFQAHRDEFPGIGSISDMSWEQWGDILMKYVDEDLAFDTKPENPAWDELVATLGLNDPAVRAALSEKTGLDFENDPFAPLKLALDCADAQHLSLQGARAMCVDDHERFRDIVVTAGKTVAIDESAALGSTDGLITLDNGGIRTAGPDDDWAQWTGPITSIDKAIRFDGRGWIDVSHPTVPVTALKTFSGDGTFEKRGVGTLLLTADSSGFAGTTLVNEGKLLVGDENGVGALGGSMTVNDGAILGGSGTIGSGAGSLVAIAAGGTLSPGNSIGTLTIDGDLSFASGSIFAVEVDPETGLSDAVTVTGKASLDGTLAHVGFDGVYDPRSTYTVLSAGEIEGQFASVTSDFAFLTPDFIYGASEIGLKLQRNDRDFASLAQTANQAAVAASVESIGFTAGNQLYDAIVMLPDDPDFIRNGFDQLSGEIHASVKSALIEESGIVRGAEADRLRAAFGTVGASSAPVLAYGPDGANLAAPDQADGIAAWGSAFGAWNKFDGNANAAGLDSATGGLLVGVDIPVAETWRVGALAGYSRSSFDSDDRASSGSSDNYSLGLYAGSQWGGLGFRSGLAYTWHQIDTSRSVYIPGLSNTLDSSYDAGTFQAFGELGYQFDLSDVQLEPFANLAYVNLDSDGYSETGGAAALNGASGSSDTTFTTVGLRVSSDFMLGQTKAKASGMIGWRHAFGDITPSVTQAFAGSTPFTITGVAVAEDAAVVEAGLDFDLSPNTTIGVSYQGQFGDDVSYNGVNARLQVKF
ncbi:autotransporter domain-containing protein [Martelella mediterranea]|uniref:Extracellular serine protease n=1 Tax=Martelella mediterranea DSM 17316 TaxID=1122214 RepID=A0A1U9YVL9_9HYPH|nr:autotransporter domain-containing protein [Martelella mediterranea]AQZ49488.1 Extracellular serine protease precursor [Martelella mediterranea DSM 17316]